MSDRRVLLALASALLIPALVACGGKKETTTTTQPTQAAQPTQSAAAQASPTRAATGPTTAPAAASPTTASGGGASNEDAAALLGVRNLKSFRATLTFEGPGVPTQQGTMAVVCPDRFQMSIAGLEIIQIGNATYTKVGNTWMAGSLGGVGIDGQAVCGSVGAVQNLTRGGTASVNGRNCQLYTATVQGSQSEFCIAGGVPIRIVTSSGGGKVTMVLTNINENIDIRAPI